MKKLFILLSIVLVGIKVNSQSVIVSFTGKDIDNKFVKIDSVIIIDLTENKRSKIIYPDTTFDLLNVGIQELGNKTNNFILSQNLPNPFNGTTNFTLQMGERENVTIEVRDILGKLIVQYSDELNAGSHSFKVNLNEPQMYFLTARTKSITTSIKMVNTESSGLAPSITSISSETVIPVQKDIEADAFNKSDTMEYVVYYHGIYTSLIKTQDASENFVFKFDPTIFVDKNVQNRTVLIEEYTGTKCGYCPDGHRISDSLVAVHHGVIYNMNIHAGSFAPGYNTTVGTLLNNYFYVSSYPAGVVSRELVRTGTSTYAYAISRGSWGYVAEQISANKSYVNVAAKTTIDETTRELTCNVQAYFTGNSTAYNGKNYIHIAVLQDSVWGPQSNGKYFYPAMWSDALGKYCHNHMLRELILGVDGENMGGISQGSTYQKTFTYTIPSQISSEDVVIPHLSVLVFVTEGEPSVSTDINNNRVRVIYVTKSEILLTGDK